MGYRQLLCDPAWIEKNKDKLKALFPETFTHMSNLNPLQIGFGFKLLGLDWRSNEQFGEIMAMLEQQRIILRSEAMLVKRNPH